MKFGEAVKTVFSKYATFSGRSRRSEFWYFFLFNFIVGLVLGALSKRSGFFYTIDGIYGLAVLIPTLAVWFRRLHDTNHSGWWLLIAFVPLVGEIVLLVFACKDSNPGPNRYGPNPKGFGML